MRRSLGSVLIASLCVLEGAGARAQKPDSSKAVVPAPVVPDTIRGLYVNRWAALAPRMWQLIDLAKTTEVNALVIDVKDDRGLLLYRSGVPVAKQIFADTSSPMTQKRLRQVLDTMKVYGIHAIARIVVAKDPLLAARKPEWSIHRKDDSTASWLDRAGKPWLDPSRPEVWDYAAQIAAEAIKLGFAQVQFDYVRFPDEPRVIEEGQYARMGGRVRAAVIRDQLARVRERLRPLGVPMTIDVFGLTATDSTDMGIGQRWEMFMDRADVVLPMTYPSHFAPGTYGLGNPNAAPYETIDNALKDIIRRSRGIAGAAKIVPWYQDFTLGPPKYGAEQVRLQILAGYANGFPSWMLWNPGSRYSEAALQRDSVSLPSPSGRR